MLSGTWLDMYIVRKLKKKFKVKCVQREQHKNDLFLHVLSGMESKDEDDIINLYLVEMIDREGLCRVNDNTYKLTEQIEVVTRHLRSDHQPCDQAIQQQIISSVLNNKPILSHWVLLASPILSRYEVFSLELLKEVVALWTTVRYFSFAKSIHDKTSQEKFKKHGTQKTLQPKNSS